MDRKVFIEAGEMLVFWIMGQLLNRQNMKTNTIINPHISS